MFCDIIIHRFFMFMFLVYINAWFLSLNNENKFFLPWLQCCRPVNCFLPDFCPSSLWTGFCYPVRNGHRSLHICEPNIRYLSTHTYPHDKLCKNSFCVPKHKHAHIMKLKGIQKNDKLFGLWLNWTVNQQNWVWYCHQIMDFL